MNPFRALLDAIRRRRLRRLAAQRLDMMLRRDGAVPIYVRRRDDAGVGSVRRAIVARYRIGSSVLRRTRPEKAVRRTA